MSPKRHARRLRVFVSFDVDHDSELYEKLLSESRVPGSGFSVAGASQRVSPTAPGDGDTAMRGRIALADQVIVICGEHTGDCFGVFGELRAAREEGKPYFMLWGRRDLMCTKPMGAETTEGMFSWTHRIIQDQLAFNQRRAQEDARTAELAQSLALLKGRPIRNEMAPTPEIESQGPGAS